MKDWDIVAVRDIKSGKVAYGVFAGAAGVSERYAISRRLARDLGRPDRDLSEYLPAGEITFQFFPNSGDSKSQVAELGRRGDELRKKAWPIVLPHYPANGQKWAEDIKKWLSAQAFTIPEVRPIKGLVPKNVEIRYFRPEDVASAWDVLQTLRQKDATLFAEARLSYRTGYTNPPAVLEVFGNQ